MNSKHYFFLPLILLILANVHSTHAQQPTWVDSGLVSWYTFDKATGADSSGNGNDLVGGFGATSIPDRFGMDSGAVFFNGADQHMLGALPDIPRGRTQRSFSLWIEPVQIPDPVLPFQFIFFYGQMADNQGMGLAYTETTSLLFAGYLNDLQANGFANTFVWTHVGMTYDGTFARIYINGVEAGADSIPEWDTQSGSLYVGMMRALGGGQTGGTTYFNPYPGAVDDFRIYDRVLSPLEVEMLAKDSLADLPPVVTSVPELALNEALHVYPNPAQDVLRLDGLNDPGMYRVVDINGREWQAGVLQPQEPISVATLPQGMYIIQVETDEGVFVRKWLKN